MRLATGDTHARRPARLELALHRDETAPGLARDAVRELCLETGMTTERSETLLLLVSEIVTNAVLHSTAPPELPIRLSVDADADRVRVDTHDGGSEFRTPAPPNRARSG